MSLPTNQDWGTAAPAGMLAKLLCLYVALCLLLSAPQEDMLIPPEREHITPVSVERHPEWETFQATAYVDRGLTKMGTKARSGVVAVDPNVIPLGTLLKIESEFPGIDGYYRAEDTGGKVKGKIIDIWLEDYTTAVEFGRRNVRVYILGEAVRWN